MTAPAMPPRSSLPTIVGDLRELDWLVEVVDQAAAPAVPRPDLAHLRAEAARLDDAYTQAIRDAARKNNWYMVPFAAHAAQQARATLRAAEQEQA